MILFQDQKKQAGGACEGVFDYVEVQLPITVLLQSSLLFFWKHFLALFLKFKQTRLSISGVTWRTSSSTILFLFSMVSDFFLLICLPDNPIQKSLWAWSSQDIWQASFCCYDGWWRDLETFLAGLHLAYKDILQSPTQMKLMAFMVDSRCRSIFFLEPGNRRKFAINNSSQTRDLISCLAIAFFVLWEKCPFEFGPNG